METLGFIIRSMSGKCRDDALNKGNERLVNLPLWRQMANQRYVEGNKHAIEAIKEDIKQSLTENPYVGFADLELVQMDTKMHEMHVDYRDCTKWKWYGRYENDLGLLTEVKAWLAEQDISSEFVGPSACNKLKIRWMDLNDMKD